MKVVVEPKAREQGFAVETKITRSDGVERVETSQPMTWTKARKTAEHFERLGVVARVVDFTGKVGTGRNGRHT